MSKITVKHYVNTDLKPIIENGIVKYSLYVQVIYSRTVYKFKSNNTTIQYISEGDLKNPLLLSLLEDEIKNISKTVELIESEKSIKLNGKTIALYSKPFETIVEQNFCKLLLQELSGVPYFFTAATYNEILEVSNYLHALDQLLIKSEKINNCHAIIGNLGYPSYTIFSANYLGIDFFAGENLHQIKDMIKSTFGGKTTDIKTPLSHIQELILL